MCFVVADEQLTSRNAATRQRAGDERRVVVVRARAAGRLADVVEHERRRGVGVAERDVGPRVGRGGARRRSRAGGWRRRSRRAGGVSCGEYPHPRPPARAGAPSDDPDERRAVPVVRAAPAVPQPRGEAVLLGLRGEVGVRRRAAEALPGRGDELVVARRGRPVRRQVLTAGLALRRRPTGSPTARPGRPARSRGCAARAGASSARSARRRLRRLPRSAATRAARAWRSAARRRLSPAAIAVSARWRRATTVGGVAAAALRGARGRASARRRALRPARTAVRICSSARWMRRRKSAVSRRFAKPSDREHDRDHVRPPARVALAQQARELRRAPARAACAAAGPAPARGRGARRCGRGSPARRRGRADRGDAALEDRDLAGRRALEPAEPADRARQRPFAVALVRIAVAQAVGAVRRRPPARP